MPRTTVKNEYPAASSRYMVPVVRSTFQVLAEMSRAGTLGLNEITKRSGVSKSTVFRILTTLNQLGYVVRDGSRKYYISRSLGELVSVSAYANLLRSLALPHMLKLRDEFGETVNLGQLEFDKVSYIEVVPSEYALRFHEKPGATVWAHATALGKAILAFSSPKLTDSLFRGRELPMLTRNTIVRMDKLLAELRRVRERGYALDRGETSLLAACVGAPILDASDTAIAAISLSGPSSRFYPRPQWPVVDELLRVTAELSRSLRGRGIGSNTSALGK